MQRWTSWAAAGVWALALAVALGAACGGKENKDEGESCALSVAGAQPIPFTADCGDPTGEGNVLTVADVAGTAAEVQDGAAFRIEGVFEFANIDRGSIELLLDCPGEDAYQACDNPFKKAKKGGFTLRANVANCADGDPTVMIVRVWDPSRGANWPMCIIHLGESTDDDATADDDGASGD
jgi:hypothetical protein